MPKCVRSAVCWLAFVTSGLWPACSFAQSEAASLSGHVVDATEAVIVNAKVEATNTDTNATFTTYTNRDGIFVFPSLRPGRYRLTVSSPGFKTVTKVDLVLHVQDQVAQNFSLPVGPASESVTVTASGQGINTESGAVSTVVDRQFVENLPLNGRSLQSLIEINPGIVVVAGASADAGYFSVNGQRPNTTYLTVDGVSGNIGIHTFGGGGQSFDGSSVGLNVLGGTSNQVSVDSLQEFRIQTSTFAPEFGRTPGGQISMVTRSGNNEFHGTVYNYFRNDALDANNWFANANRQSKPALRQNNFGGVIGGPLYLPRIGKGGPAVYSGKNRTFFFFSYEGLRLRQPRFAITEVPSADSRANSSVSIRPYLDAFPLPNGSASSAGFARFSAGFSDPSTTNATSIRLDQKLGGSLTLFGRLNIAPSTSRQRTTAGSSVNTIGITEFNTHTLTIGADLRLSSTIYNEARGNYSKQQGDSFFVADNFGGAVPLQESAVLPGFLSQTRGLYTLFFNGIQNGALRLARSAANHQEQINLVDAVSVVRSAHTLKFGVDYRRLMPVYNPTGSFTVVAPPSVQPLAGRSNTVSLRIFDGPFHLRYSSFSLFAQDMWQALRRLTLTYGVRWDYNSVPFERDGKALPTVTGLDNPATLTLAPTATPLWKARKTNFGPRFGAAYQLSQSTGHETVLRGGFGVFYDLPNFLIGSAYEGTTPYSVPLTISGTAYPLDPPLVMPPSFGLRPPFSLTVPAPGFREPYSLEWNLALERAIGSAQTLSFTYVGAAGRRLTRLELIQSPNPNFRQIALMRNVATSDYRALQLQYQRRLARRFQAMASYSFARADDTASVGNVSLAPAGKIGIESERGPSDFDVRHTFTAALTYNLPSPTVKRIAKNISGNWAIDAVVRAGSPTPVNVIAGTDLLAVGLTTVARPDLVSGVPLYVKDSSAPGGKRFNRAAFTIPPAGRQGTLPRNALRGFQVSQVDFDIRRQFNLGETMRLQVKAEFFNLFNHPNFANPVANLASGLFGQSTQMFGTSLGSSGAAGGAFNALYQIGGPRSTQVSLRLSF